MGLADIRQSLFALRAPRCLVWPVQLAHVRASRCQEYQEHTHPQAGDRQLSAGNLAIANSSNGPTAVRLRPCSEWLQPLQSCLLQPILKSIRTVAYAYRAVSHPFGNGASVQE
jgi:hypothetical protein